MAKKIKSECNNQWAGTNIAWTSKTGVKEKDERNNQWASTLKKSAEVYGENNHLEDENN